MDKRCAELTVVTVRISTQRLLSMSVSCYERVIQLHGVHLHMQCVYHFASPLIHSAYCYYFTVSERGCHCVFSANFAKYWPIVKILSRRTHNRRSGSHWWLQLESHKWLRKHEFDTCRSRIQGLRAVIVMWWCCIRYCPQYARSHITHEAVNFARYWLISKILWSQTRQ